MGTTLLDGASLDIAAEKRSALLDLVPEARTEGGKVDFNVLKRALGETVDPGRERYGLTWPGKANCFQAIQAASLATLLPLPGKSVDFDTTENVIIEGDNLEVLKLLQKSYLGKIRMIYIDPPYNTGNDFIYPDNYSESLQTYLEYTRQVDAEGRKIGTNSDVDGRFHSKWLNMMYPRLYLARNLLNDDGVVFLSIDDNEVQSLRFVMNELFGEENFLAQITVISNPKGRVLGEHFAKSHDYLLVYSKAALRSELSIAKTDDEVEGQYTESDARGNYRLLELRNTHRQFGRVNRRNLYFPIYVNPSDGAVSAVEATSSIAVLPNWDDGFEGCWTWGAEKVSHDNQLLVGRQVAGRWKIYRKAYGKTSDGENARKKLQTVWSDREFHTEKGQAAFDALIPGRVFQSPKPVGLLKTIASLSSDPNGIFLDFFAGSGTLGQAVLELNKDDDGQRRFILIQLPELTKHPEFPTIADITMERVRRSITALNDADAATLKLGSDNSQDRGFRAFKLAESNVKEWDATIARASEGSDADALDEQLALHVDHLRHDRSDLDLIYEISLKEGFPLSSRVSTEIVAERTVYSVSDGAFLICLDRNLDLGLVRAIAARQPERVLLLDEGFAGNDQLKTNAVQTFKAKNIVLKTL
jgi:adenine-specific DNA-methyltransferase